MDWQKQDLDIGSWKPADSDRQASSDDHTSHVSLSRSLRTRCSRNIKSRRARVWRFHLTGLTTSGLCLPLRRSRPRAVSPGAAD